MTRMRLCKYLLALACAAGWASVRPVLAQPQDTAVVPVPEEFAVTLRVLKPDGTPLRNGAISIARLSSRGVEAGYSSSIVSPADMGVLGLGPRTDDQGIFSTNIRARSGRHTLYLRAPGEGVVVVPLLELDAKKPQTVEVRLQPEGSVRATARDQKGVALGGARLMIVPVDADAMVDEKSRDDPGALSWLIPVDDTRRVTRDGDGTLEMSGLREGKYFATLNVPGYRVASATPIQTISIVGNGVTELSLVFEPVVGAPLRLQVLDAAGAPLAGQEVRVTLQFDFPGSRAVLPSRVAMAAMGTIASFVGDSYMERRGITDKAGRLSINPVMRGPWNITLKDASWDDAAKAVAQVGREGGEATLKLGGPYKDGERSYDSLGAAAIVEK